MKFIFTLKNLLAGIFMVAGGLLLQQTYAERVVFFTSSDELGPMTYPRYLLWAWMILSAFYLVIPRRAFNAEIIRSSLPLLTGSVLSIILYMVLFKYLGLFISTFTFLLIFFYILNYRNPGRMVLLASVTAFSVWIIFEKLLEVPMPSNILGSLMGG